MSGSRLISSSATGLTRIIGSARGINLAATGDRATIAIPASISKYCILQILLTNASATPILAQVGVYTGAGASGTTLVTAGAITGATAATVALGLTLAGTIAATALTASTLYVNVPVANASALTADIYVVAVDLT